jgi:hypothetical protein
MGVLDSERTICAARFGTTSWIVTEGVQFANGWDPIAL